MAKKQQNSNAKSIDCKQCVFGGEVFNHMIDCSNKVRNPTGLKSVIGPVLVPISRKSNNVTVWQIND